MLLNLRSRLEFRGNLTIMKVKCIAHRHSLRWAGLRVAGTLPLGQLAVGAAVVGGHGGAVQLIPALYSLHLAAWGRVTGPLSPA